MCRKAHGSGRSTPENTTLLVQRDRTRQDRVKAQHFRPPLALTFGDGLGNSAGDRGVDIGLVRDVGVWESGEGSPLLRPSPIEENRSHRDEEHAPTTTARPPKRVAK